MRSSMRNALLGAVLVRRSARGSIDRSTSTYMRKVAISRIAAPSANRRAMNISMGGSHSGVRGSRTVARTVSRH